MNKNLNRAKKAVVSFVIIACFLAFMVFSCDFEPWYETRNFWAINFQGGSQTYYQLEAQLMANNDFVEIWVEKGIGVTETQAKAVANEYKNNMYSKMINAFGWDDFGLDTMGWADFFGNDDGKLTILILDIKDNYSTTNAYVGGYFLWLDFLGDGQVSGHRSNQRDMIYMRGTAPFTVGSQEFYDTLAHEMQHIMNFATTLYLRSDLNDQGQIIDWHPMDTWIDEGLSESASYVYSGNHNMGRINWYNNGSGSLISKGNNFYIWNNRVGSGLHQSQVAVLDDYATVYLFFQWMRSHWGNPIFSQISISEDSNYEAVVEAVKSKNGALNTWEKILETWLAANNIQASGSNGVNLLGYANDSTLNTLTKHYIHGIGQETYALFPGEGVYSVISETPIFTNNGNILHRFLSSGVAEGYTTQNVMLTFNKNHLLTLTTEPGYITDIPPTASIIPSASWIDQPFTGPYQIGAFDLIRQNGGNTIQYNTVPNFSLNESRIGLFPYRGTR